MIRSSTSAYFWNLLSFHDNCDLKALKVLKSTYSTKNIFCFLVHELFPLMGHWRQHNSETLDYSPQRDQKWLCALNAMMREEINISFANNARCLHNYQSFSRALQRPKVCLLHTLCVAFKGSTAQVSVYLRSTQSLYLMQIIPSSFAALKIRKELCEEL